jgi:AcrR family transcriptional regulator
MSRRRDAVAAAIRCLERGDKPGINNVARELGIQPPSLYKHVEDAADLDQSVAIECFGRLAEWLLATPLRGTPRQRLRQLMASDRAFARANHGLHEHMSRVALDPTTPDVVALTERIFAIFAGPLDGVGLPKRDRVHAVRAMRAAVQGFVALELAGQFRMDVDAEESFERLCRWLIGGL